MDATLIVRTGQRITAILWNKLVAAVRSCRVLAGEGIRLRITPNGTIVSCSTWKPWNHPFKVSMGPESATVERGLIDGIEPTIDGVPIGGDADKNKPQPKLKIKPPKTGKDGRGWIAVEITCDTEKQWAVKSAEIVQVAELLVSDKAKARHPIAMLRRGKTGDLSHFQIEFFNLQHRADVQDASARHFFWPA